VALRECELTRWLCDELRACGAIVIVQQAGVFSQGWPDRLLVTIGWMGFLEMKGVDGKLTGRQARNLREIHKRQPGHARVVRFGETESGPHRLYDYSMTEWVEFVTARQLLGLLGAK